MVQTLTPRQLDRLNVVVDVDDHALIPMNLLASIIRAFSSSFYSKFMAADTADDVFAELVVRLPLSESRFTRNGRNIRLYREDETASRVTSIGWGWRDGLWQPEFTNVCYYFEESTDLPLEDFASVANVVLRTIIGEKIWTKAEIAVWTDERFTQRNVGFANELLMTRLGIGDDKAADEADEDFVDDESDGDSVESDSGLVAEGDVEMVEDAELPAHIQRELAGEEMDPLLLERNNVFQLPIRAPLPPRQQQEL